MNQNGRAISVGEASLPRPKKSSLLMSRRTGMRKWLMTRLGQLTLFMITATSAAAIFFILFYIVKDALVFFKLRGLREFFTGLAWYPSAEPAEFGAFSIFVGSALVTVFSVGVAVPLGVSASVCMSDVLPFRWRQAIKPVIEILAAIPSVAYGFFALVVLAPLLQSDGGRVLAVISWLIGAPLAVMAVFLAASIVTAPLSESIRKPARIVAQLLLAAASFWGLYRLGLHWDSLTFASGANAFNVSLILAIMVLPTVVSVSEDALQAVGRELREGSYALGATRAETLVKVVIPAAGSGIFAAVILGVMRAIGETMVVWMASGNAAQIPKPWYNLFEPVRTLTATIAGDMGEADHVTGSARYHVLFAMAACLLAFSFTCSLVSELIIARARKRLKGG